ncbi:MAG: 3-keto-5-aminohexanoate cleavage protein [Rhodobacteraceae bacterium]|nr:3-keto-5-aminohexanoate cleavage protein [Paracoccaceae bacterium]
MQRSFLLTIAPNGARLGRADHPRLPLTPDDLAQTARACQDAGAGAIHLHVRGAKGAHSLDAMRYRDAITAIHAAAPGMEIQVTTEAAGIFDVAAQLRCLEEVRPDAASVAIIEMARDIETARQIYAFAEKAGIRLQHILYNTNDASILAKWIAQGIVRLGQRDVLFVLGAYSDQRAGHPSDLPPFLAATQGLDLNWSVCAFGRDEQACLLSAIKLGGGVRVGFENNMAAPDGSRYADNAASVAALVEAAAALGFTPRKARI